MSGLDQDSSGSIGLGWYTTESDRIGHAMPLEYVARWSGGPIGAGATVLHFVSVGGGASAQTIADATRTMFETIKAVIPSAVTVSYDSEVKELGNDGSLLAVYPVTTPTQTTMTGTGSYAAGVGAMVRHTTGVILGGKRIQGRTFIVPLTAGQYASVGTLSGTVVTLLNGAFSTLRTTTAGLGSPLAVWSRANASVSAVSASTTVTRVSNLSTRNDRL